MCRDVVGVDAMKRGVLLALGSFFVVTALFAFALFIASQQNAHDKHAVQLAALERTAAVEDSVLSSLGAVWNATAGMSVDGGADDVTVHDSLPASGVLSSEISNLNTFITAQDTNVHIDMNGNAGTLALPDGVTYARTADRQVTVNAAPLPGNRYAVTVTVGANITSCAESVTAGAFELAVRVDGAGGSDCVKELGVDSAANNRVAIGTDAGTIDVDLNATTLIISSAPDIELATQLRYNRTSGQRGEARLMNVQATVAIPNLKLVRTDTPIVAVW